MTFQARPAGIGVAPLGPIRGTAWVTAAQPGVEMHVLGKLMLQLGRDGNMSIVTTPELPGWNQGRAAHEELDASQGRKLIVRGHRTRPGRAILRRGATPIVEVPFEPGVQPVIATLPNTMQTTVGSRRGDDWLVVEGVEGPETRRWCKLPKLGILATWDEIERLLLTSKVCLIDVSSWTIAFVLRASRKLPHTMIPGRVTLSMMDLAEGGAAVMASVSPARSPSAADIPAVNAPSPSATLASNPHPPVRTPSGVIPAVSAPIPQPARSPSGVMAVAGLSTSPMPTLTSTPVVSQQQPVIDDEDSSVASGGFTRQVNPEELAKLLATVQAPAQPALDDGNDEGPTKVFGNADLMRIIEKASSEQGSPTSTDPTKPIPALAQMAVREAAPLPRRTERPAPPAPPLEVHEPGEVTRAFHNITDQRFLQQLVTQAAPVAPPPHVAPPAYVAPPAHVAPPGRASSPAIAVPAPIPQPQRVSSPAIAVPPAAAPAGHVRAEIERRLKEGEPLKGLTIAGAALAGLPARNADFTDLDLSGADLTGADLTGADFTRACLDGARLDGARLDSADLSGASFECATMSRASLRRASLTGASFAGADLREADLRQAHPPAALVGANLAGAKLD